MVSPRASLLSSTHSSLLFASRSRHTHPGTVKICRRSVKSLRIAENPLSSAGGDPIGFAFDIDGVLLRGKQPIPGARTTLENLKSQRIPFVLLTNGGGKHEAERAQELSELLETPISSKILIQSHTPFKQLVNGVSRKRYPRLGNKCVLVIGGEGNKCREIAESYGFRNVVTPADLIAAEPELWPFANLDLYRSLARPLPKPLCPEPVKDKEGIGNYLCIDGILVFHDSRDWGLDIQIIMDAFGSYQGCLGTPKTTFLESDEHSEASYKAKIPYLIFSNPDLVWQSSYSLARFGQGALIFALKALWTREYGNLDRFQCDYGGKPNRRQFSFAYEKLNDAYQSSLDIPRITKGKRKQLGRVYMIGDNPQSDIVGANRYNLSSSVPFFPILTRTGVYKSNPNVPLLSSRRPVNTVDDVSAAVNWALEDSQDSRAVDQGLWDHMRQRLQIRLQNKSH